MPTLRSADRNVGQTPALLFSSHSEVHPRVYLKAIHFKFFVKVFNS